MYEIKKREDNKLLMSNLKIRMFRGYHQVIKNSRNKKSKKNKKISPLTPRLKENTKPYNRTFEDGFIVKIKTNKEILPFEYDYQEVYKNKYLKNFKNNKIDQNDIQIINFSKKNIKKKNSLTKGNQQLFLTERKNFTRNKDIRDEINKERTLNLIFPYKDEIKKFSNLPFFSLTKNKVNEEIDVNKYSSRNESKNRIKNIENILQEDFLFKISHQKDDEQNNINNNFIKNKGIKKGITFDLNENFSNSKKDLKLKIDIQNLNNNKTPYLSSKEKRYKIIEREVEPFKNIVSLFNDFETKFLADDDKKNNNNNNKEENKIEENKDNQNNNININNDGMKTKIISGRNFDGLYHPYRTTCNWKKPKLYPVNYYSFKQLKRKETKYENVHKLAFEQFHKKINLREDEHKAKTSRNNLNEFEKAYFEKLYTKKEVTNKMIFNRECRIRDIILTNKLKCEFSPSDIKRVLNGQKTWNECERCDKKYLLKKLPNCVDDFKIN